MLKCKAIYNDINTMYLIFSLSAQDFAFETHIDFILDGGITGYLKIKEMKLNLSLKSLDVSKLIIKIWIRFYFFFLSQSSQLTVTSLSVKFQLYIADNSENF